MESSTRQSGGSRAHDGVRLAVATAVALTLGVLLGVQLGVHSSQATSAAVAARDAFAGAPPLFANPPPPLSKELPPASRVAVVMPFIGSQVARVKKSLLHWRAQPPCDDGGAALAALGVSVTFVFHFNAFIDAPLQASLTQAWEQGASPEAARCFAGGVQFVSANQTQEQEADRTTGGCWQHHRTFRAMHAAGFQHWLQYEPDVLPVRPNWLLRVAQEAAPNEDCARWWVQGSPPAYEPLRVTHGERIDGFILNGNALYCLNAEVLRFLDVVTAQYPPVACSVPHARARDGLVNLVGFDWVYYLARTSVENRELLKGRAYLFRAVDWILDFGVATSTSQLPAILQAHPSVVLLHTKMFEA
jgi:hypothetical protein